jgi:hypothetical protein
MNVTEGRGRAYLWTCCLWAACCCACTSDSSDDAAALAGGGGSAGALGSAGSAAAGAAGSAGEGSGGSAGEGSSGSAGNSAGAGGLGGSGGGAGLCPAGALFCDDFETDAVGQPPAEPWRASTNAGTVAVDSTRAFSGSNALLATAPNGPNYRRAFIGLGSGSPIFPGAASEMYGRAMIWLEAAPTEVHWTMIQAQGRAAVGTHDAEYRYGGQHGTGLLMANYETNNNVRTDCWDHSQTVVPTGKWACVEWRFAVATNEMQFWLDGTEISDIHVTDRGEGCGGNDLNGQWLAPPAFDNLFLGWEHYQAWSGDIRIWLDAVAVSTERVGCPAP